MQQRKILIVLLLFVVALGALDAQEATVTMNFQGVDMNVFLEWFAEITNKKIILGQTSGGQGQRKVYLIAHEPVPEKNVENICMSILESNGFTLVKSGMGKSEVYKLVETSNASTKPIAIYSEEEIEKIETGDYYISQLVIVKYLKASNVLASIQQARILDPKHGTIVEIRGANALIISDFLPNIKRILIIIKMLDQPPPKVEFAYVKLKYAKADEVSQKLQQLLQNQAREMAEYKSNDIVPSIISDGRTNSLTIRGQASDIKEIKAMIKHFDEEIKESEVATKIYYLENVTSEKIAPTLREYIATPLFKDKSQVSQISSANSSISIIPNEYTRSLIVVAPISAHKLLHEVIKKLDIRRPQVMLEAVICEFTPSDVLNFGIELLRLDGIDSKGTNPVGVTSFGLSSIVDKNGNPVSAERPQSAAGRGVVPGNGLTAFTTRDNAFNIPFLVRALQSVSNTEVIAMPKIITDDGERAEIRVEQEEPVTAVSALNTSTTTVSFKEFVSAGTVLILKPQIIHKNWLRLEIELNIDAFIGSPPAVGVPPAKSRRSIKTIVTVPNGRTIILGGLCGRREVETVDKIPLIGDIPLLGLLFQSRSNSVSKTNLYIFIRPQVLHDPDFKDLEKMSKEDQDKIEKIFGQSLEDSQKELEKK